MEPSFWPAMTVAAIGGLVSVAAPVLAYGAVTLRRLARDAKDAREMAAETRLEIMRQTREITRLENERAKILAANRSLEAALKKAEAEGREKLRHIEFEAAE